MQSQAVSRESIANFENLRLENLISCFLYQKCSLQIEQSKLD